MYSLQQFGYMIRDSVRISAFDEALRRAVKPGDVVVDIGAGTGIFALMACKYGARHVYAIEPNPLISLGPEMARLNGFADRITFIRDVSQRVTLPEKADIAIGDLRGRLPTFDFMVDTFRDARERLLKPDAIIIPQRDTVYATFFSDAAKYQFDVRSPWIDNLVGLRLDSVMNIITNTTMADPISKPDVLLTPQPWAILDYQNTHIDWVQEPLSWTVDSPLTVHFAAAWFDAQLFEDVGFSNAPGVPSPQVYQRTLMPLKQPIDLAAGERITLRISVRQFNDEYQLYWTTQVYAPGADAPRLTLQQTNFYAVPLYELKKRASSYVPRIRQQGRMVARALTLMQGEDSLGTIAGIIQAEYPAVFPDHGAALSFVASLSQQYSD
jgi:protein arginine N-methyltransferase 1